MGTTFFVEGVNKFFVCTWVKNGFRGGDVFGLGEGGEGVGRFFFK